MEKESAKIVEWVDIGAPFDDVYETLMDLERRMQLSPLYGTAILTEVSPDYPEVGSYFWLQLREEEGKGYTYKTVVTEYNPRSKFAYRIEIKRQTHVTWLFQDTGRGKTRVIYEEEFACREEGQEEEFTKSVRDAVSEWLRNIKFYLELRDDRFKLGVKWFLDRFFLKLRNDQRKVIAMLVFMQVAGCLSFTMAAIALAIARTLFGE